MRLHADGVDDRVGAAAIGHIADDVAELVVDLGEIDGAHPARGGAGQPLRHPVDGDDAVAEVLRDTRGHVADRAEAEHGHRPPSGMSAYCTACQAVGRTSDR